MYMLPVGNNSYDNDYKQQPTKYATDNLGGIVCKLVSLQ